MDCRLCMDQSSKCCCIGLISIHEIQPMSYFEFKMYNVITTYIIIVQSTLVQCGTTLLPHSVLFLVKWSLRRSLCSEYVELPMGSVW